jgi:CAAX protease family protein
MTAMQQLSENLMNVALGLGELVLLVAVVSLIRRRLPNLGDVGIALAVLFAAHVALFVGMIPKTPLSWNWIGKALSIAVTVAAVALIPSVTWRDAGFTWRQGGGLIPAVLAAVVVCAFGWGSNVLFGGIHLKHPGLETLLYQATMPGLNEEPLYRGITLFLLDRAFRDERVAVFGAPIGWGALITSIWFGLIHGNGIVHGQFQIAVLPIAIIAIIGFGLAWIRMRTGSIAACIATHNVLNLAQQFF